MSYMKEKMIKMHNDMTDLYYEIKEEMESKYDIDQKVSNILAKCKDFEYRHPLHNKPI